jgi:ElaB/YqjD/DUF883 family membrane-anchored ribosome-binding protein
MSPNDPNSAEFSTSSDPIPPEVKSPSGLEREGDEIRADMDRTLDALERKLSPGQILDRSVDYLRTNASSLANSVGEAVRRHPGPAVMTCVGLIWLGTSLTRERLPGQASPQMNDRQSDAGPEGSTAEGTIGRVRASAVRAKDKAKDKVGAAAGEVLNAVQQRTSEWRGGLNEVVTQHPLAFGALAIAVGAVLGAAIPATQIEQQKVGPVRDRALAKVEELGSRTYDRVKESLSAAKPGRTEDSAAK